MSRLNDLKIYLRMLFHYNPKKYWNELLSQSFNLRGVGHYRMSTEQNERMYQEKERTLSQEIDRFAIPVGHSVKVL